MFVNPDAGIGEVIARMARPSNFHAHLRREALMRAVAPQIMRHMRYVLAMPNTGPIVTIEGALSYLAELEALAQKSVTHPIDFVMTLYLTDKVTPKVIETLRRLPIPFGVKYYPPQPGATTGSGFGIPLDRCDDVLRAMEETGIPLLGHFETVEDKHGNVIPPEKREAHMIEETLWALRNRYPELYHCVEHASTKEAVRYVRADPSGRTVMTVTPQHSLFIGDDFEELGTDLKCMPIVKTAADRAAIVEFITSGDSRAIAGDDTAPHPHQKKATGFAEAANGCWLPHSLELYASVFHHAEALDDRFERFMSLNGPRWWDLPVPDEDDTVELVRQEAPIPEPVPIEGEDDVVVPLGWGVPGQRLEFTVA